MKKHLLVACIVLLGGCANAASVSVQKAQTIAINFFKVTVGNGNNSGISATLKYTRIEGDNSIDFYVFDIAPAKGFVVVAGNDNTIPVLGYSSETNFRLDAPLTTGINYWLSHTAARIHKSYLLGIEADSRINTLWNAYMNGINPHVSRSGSVTPLLSTTWDQEPYYNDLCPYNYTDNRRAVTGCVATTMAQIMKYWAYPTRGRGSYTYVDSTPAFSNNYGRLTANFDTVYNWAQMPNSISSANANIARLMYDLGVSVAMDYGDDNEGGSGAWVLQSEAGAGGPCSQYAFVNYFYYNPNSIQGIVKSNYTPSDFIYLIENELNNKRVVQYEGDDTNGGGGHTWVCDGYDASDLLHMNWGWSGQNDGYFAVTNLDAGSYNFNDAEAVLIGIEPISPVNVTAIAAKPSICPGSSTTLTAHGPATATYTWTPTSGLSCPTCSTTNVSPIHDEVYVVTVDSSGVKGSATVALNIVGAAAANFSVNTATINCSAPAVVPFNNLSANGTNYVWDFGDGSIDTAANPLHTYTSYGTYNVKLSSYNNCSSDSVLRNQAVHLTDEAPVIAGQSICFGNTATLNATGNGVIQWYDAPTGGNLVNTGNSFTTPVLNGSTTYYLSSVIAPPGNTAGPVDNTIGAGGYFNGTNEHGLVFNCTVPQTLISVDVYAQGAGNRTIMLEDSNGSLLSSVTVNVPNGQSTVTLNFSLPAQNGMKLAIKGNDNLYRNNSGAGYPYTSADGTVSITNSDAGTAGYYYFFYNWKLQQPGCTTSTTVVPVTVLHGNNGSIIETATGTSVTFTAPPGITSCQWFFGDGTNSTQLSASHHYATVGSYTVMLVESNGQCLDTVTEVISLYPAGINDAGKVESLTLFPDPAHDQLNVHIENTGSKDMWTLTVSNILGQKMQEREIELQAGENSIALNVLTLAAGVHLLSLQNGNTRVTRRFVKTN